MSGYFIVEDANNPAIMNAFAWNSLHPYEITRNTVPQFFYTRYEAKAFAKICKERYPDSNPVVVSKMFPPWMDQVKPGQ